MNELITNNSFMLLKKILYYNIQLHDNKCSVLYQYKGLGAFLENLVESRLHRKCNLLPKDINSYPLYL